MLGSKGTKVAAYFYSARFCKNADFVSNQKLDERKRGGKSFTDVQTSVIYYTHMLLTRHFAPESALPKVQRCTLQQIHNLSLFSNSNGSSGDALSCHSFYLNETINNLTQRFSRNILWKLL